MPELTVGRMAKLYRMNRSSLYEAVAKGRVSAGLNGKGQQVIDLSEMLRVFGEAPGATQQNPTPDPAASPTPSTGALEPLLAELRLLREEQQATREENRLLREEMQNLRETMLRIEHKPDAVPPPAAIAHLAWWKRLWS
ncbi:hypothetical protein [Azotobacter beijerinckii]|uniref:hypothetical protein n=1 Tax=Azotobacter beijerinckii TaxID=170623 RepID=UPI00295405C2|nr:hypothetical protein [Azotobacter beijerinckii]MDV7213601.1 hypothetical protein [Azotobacter beijerinckii]